MQIIGKLFNIIIFMSLVSSLFAIIFLFLQKTLRFALPLWVGIFGAVFYLMPITVPNVKLISPEETFWIVGYKVSSIVWVIGALVFLLYYLLRSILAYLAIKSYDDCKDERMNFIYNKCANELSLNKLPKLLFGGLKEPACVVTVFHPAVILNENIVKELSDRELEVILCHELMHIKRKHHFFQRVYDLISIFYWFNPMMWVVKYEFSYTCEMDCDNQLVKNFTAKEYTSAIIRLLELSTGAKSTAYGKINALGFLMVKQRLINILNKSSKQKRIFTAIIVTICIGFTIMSSAFISRSVFYPYPAYNRGIYEYNNGFDE